MDTLLFSASGGRYLAPLADLDEVLMPVRLRPLARAPAFLAGVFNLRGATLPVLDLGERLGLGGPERALAVQRRWQRGNRILRFQAGPVALGLIVDAVTGIHHLTQAERRDPVLASHASAPFLGDLWLVDGQLTQTLHLARLLAPEELAQLRGGAALETV